MMKENQTADMVAAMMIALSDGSDNGTKTIIEKTLELFCGVKFDSVFTAPHERQLKKLIAGEIDGKTGWNDSEWVRKNTIGMINKVLHGIPGLSQSIGGVKAKDVNDTADSLASIMNYCAFFICVVEREKEADKKRNTGVPIEPETINKDSWHTLVMKSNGAGRFMCPRCDITHNIGEYGSVIGGAFSCPSCEFVFVP